MNTSAAAHSTSPDTPLRPLEVETMDVANATLQREIAAAEPGLAIELAQLKLVLNQHFNRRRSPKN